MAPEREGAGMCVWLGGGGSCFMKNKFQKASITFAGAGAPAFAFQCAVQPPLFMTLYTSKPRPASLRLPPPPPPHSHSNHQLCLSVGERERDTLPVGCVATCGNFQINWRPVAQSAPCISFNMWPSPGTDGGEMFSPRWRLCCVYRFTQLSSVCLGDEEEFYGDINI